MRPAHLSLLFLVSCSLASVTLGDDWWEHGHFYQIYPRSFQDSDGDGIGDLNGITSRLEYLRNISVTGVLLSSILQSSMLDLGYDISNFRKIHNEFGTMADFHRLIALCKELDIKLILYFVPNHTSDQHEWFQKSADPEHPEHEKYKDYYIWNEGKMLANGTRVPPSNWLNVFKGSAWTWVNSRKSFYLHQFLKEQPDLNFRNRNVSEEMKEVLRFWLRKGVSGIRVDAVAHLFEVDKNGDGFYDDESLSGQCVDDHQAYCRLTHTKTTHLDETYDMIHQWRSVIDEDEFKYETRILVVEANGSVAQITRFYGEFANNQKFRYGSQIPSNSAFINLSQRTSSSESINILREWSSNKLKVVGIQSNWMLGNHDTSRSATKFGNDRIDIFNILTKTLPGITITYNGEEIGMTNLEQNSIDERLKSRSPFQWDNTINAGFSTNPKTWLPVANTYETVNVHLQESADVSHLKIFQKLMLLRHNPTLKYGTLTIASVYENDLVVYKRERENEPDADVFVVVLNLTHGSSVPYVDLNSLLGGLPEKMKIVVSSIRSNRIGEMVDTGNFHTEAHEGVVLIGRKL